LRLESPAWATLQWLSAAIAAAAMLAMLRFKVGMGWVLGASGLVGVLWTLVFRS
jgi:chromate transporter